MKRGFCVENEFTEVKLQCAMKSEEPGGGGKGADINAFERKKDRAKEATPSASSAKSESLDGWQREGKNNSEKMRELRPSLLRLLFLCEVYHMAARTLSGRCNQKRFKAALTMPTYAEGAFPTLKNRKFLSFHALGRMTLWARHWGQLRLTRLLGRLLSHRRFRCVPVVGRRRGVGSGGGM